MKVIAPKMKALQEQYANDKQQLQVKMMEMYKQEKINPLGGCLPILVQIPVFIALYWVLLSAVELRHAPWILLDPGSLGAGSVLRAAGDLRDHRVPAGEAVADADLRSGAGEGDADHADRVLGDVRLLPVGPRALLARQQLAADLPAVAHEPRAREGSGAARPPSGASAAQRSPAAPLADTIAAIATPAGSRRRRRDPRVRAAASSAIIAGMLRGPLAPRVATLRHVPRRARRSARPGPRASLSGAAVLHGRGRARAARPRRARRAAAPARALRRAGRAPRAARANSRSAPSSTASSTSRRPRAWPT